jgi:glycosyltransferase involved in cell wall biosynthesis
VGGSEIYARRLVGALARARPDVRWIVWCGREAEPVLRSWGWPANVSIRVLARLKARVKPLRLLVELAVLPLAARRARVELLHSLGTTSPLWGAVPRVVTVLDLIYLHFPDTFPTAARLGLRAVVGPAARRCRRVLAISHAAKADLVEHLRLDPDRVDVVHLGLGTPPETAPTPPERLRERLGLPGGPVVLCVSAALAHKNLARLVEALPQVPEATLVIAGHRGRDAHALEALAADRGVAGRLRLTGWLSDADLEGLYALADCFAYPSLHEGFGLPILEAVRRQVPVACSDATALPEVAGDAAELFDPHDTVALGAAIRRILDDPEHAAALVARGAARVERFSWEACAAGVLRSYERAA